MLLVCAYFDKALTVSDIDSNAYIKADSQQDSGCVPGRLLQGIHLWSINNDSVIDLNIARSRGTHRRDITTSQLGLP